MRIIIALTLIDTSDPTPATGNTAQSPTTRTQSSLSHALVGAKNNNGLMPHALTNNQTPSIFANFASYAPVFASAQIGTQTPFLLANKIPTIRKIHISFQVHF